jgi:hypothetical protein
LVCLLSFRRTSGIELAIKYMKKFDYFVPCYYDLLKNRTADKTEFVQMDTSEYYSE